MTDPTERGWHPDPNTPGVRRYFDGIEWTDVTVSADDPPLPTGQGGISRPAAVAVGVCVLSGVGIVMSMQSTNLFAGTGTIWTGVGLTAAGAAAAFFLGAEKWVRVLAVVLLVGAVFNAGYMEKQLSDKRNEISRMFNPAASAPTAEPTVSVPSSVAMPIAAGDDADAYDYSMDLQDAALEYTGAKRFGATCAQSSWPCVVYTLGSTDVGWVEVKLLADADCGDWEQPITQGVAEAASASGITPAPRVTVFRRDGSRC